MSEELPSNLDEVLQQLHAVTAEQAEADVDEEAARNSVADSSGGALTGDFLRLFLFYKAVFDNGSVVITRLRTDKVVFRGTCESECHIHS